MQQTTAAPYWEQDQVCVSDGRVCGCLIAVYALVSDFHLVDNHDSNSLSD